MLNFISTITGVLSGIISEIGLKVMALFGYTPIVEFEPTVFKAIFEAIKSIIAG